MELVTHDLASLPDLNEEIILNFLKVRYTADIIYTYIGDILLAINPFKELSIYDTKMHKLCTNLNQDAPPHVYALADFAYECLKNSSYKSQCCVISGESGAGKTESAKHFINHLIYLCLGNTRLELQILQVNPLLEAFGNATTLMNDNSSRFGKYIELSFHNNKVVGAKISEYLLEKSRVVFQNIGENNFHIFYYLLVGLECQSDKYYLTNKNGDHLEFNYLNYFCPNKISSKNLRLDLMEKYDQLINALNYVAFLENEQTDLFAALIGILHVGNLEFKSNDEGYATFIYSENTDYSLMAIYELLGINTGALIEALTASLPTAGGRDEFIRNHTLEAALDARDALAKHVYSRLFYWIVSKINNTLSYDKSEKSASSIKEIGILDIYGFEHFQKNSFEQLCINLANEQIQYFFNKHIFSLEKEEYGREGINSIAITFNDNQPLLELFMGPSGMLKKLDDLCKLPRANDLTLIQNFNKDFSKNSNYIPSKRSELNFTINHYAGKVTYTGENFLEKNRDSLPFRVSELLKNSSNDIISEIFSNGSTPQNTIYSSYTVCTIRNIDKNSNRLSVSAQYRNSLEILMKRMSESRPIFLRCIKPNSSKRPDDFNEKFVLLQLRYCGVLETIRIRREGFSLRPTFQEFVDRYKYLSPDSFVKYDSHTCKKILETNNLNNWRVGKSKVFLKYYHYEKLKVILDEYNNHAIIIQKYVRVWLARKEFRRRFERSRREKYKMAEFLVNLHSKSSSIYQFVTKTALLKLQKSKEIREDSNEIQSHRNKVERNPSRSTNVGQSVNAKIYDNLNNKVVNGMNKSPAKKSSEPKKGPVWLYGKITRGQSEEFLKNKEIGTYLVRKSDSRDGYSLSFKAENRCRHYMVDALPNGKFIIIGEPRVHNSLKDLIEYHKKHKLSNWNGYLSVPFTKD
ncbi:myosin-IIIb-like isoform X1 [Brachionus plicatilis]|uniref:non-specific serine/threonine protein kinase n=1 Tax=Brachionus plicatilis TaxID=10195 RepID=A0A3M7R0M2_BRAPC|nr:myosin-IIIb-like isoform X1 [Brachionus plicatilis]